MTTLAFIYTETTGLHPVRHEIWEIGLILRRDDSRAEYVWQLPVDLGRADPIALNIGRFHERRGQPGTNNYFPGPDAFDQSGEFSVPGVSIPPKVIHTQNLPWFCGMLSRLTWGAHLIGAVPSFDSERLDRLFRRNHAIAGWHYHLIDVEALAVGWLAGRYQDPEWPAPTDDPGVIIDPPWSSETLSESIGVSPGMFDRHSALGDARWAEAMFDAVMKLKAP